MHKKCPRWNLAFMAQGKEKIFFARPWREGLVSNTSVFLDYFNN
jgi:hypothetical protein